MPDRVAIIIMCIYIVVLQVNCEQKSDCDEENLFACKTSQSSKTQCIWDVYVCDGSSDCEDGSDEVNCTGLFLNLFACKTSQSSKTQCI